MMKRRTSDDDNGGNDPNDGNCREGKKRRLATPQHWIHPPVPLFCCYAPSSFLSFWFQCYLLVVFLLLLIDTFVSSRFETQREVMLSLNFYVFVWASSGCIFVFSRKVSSAHFVQYFPPPSSVYKQSKKFVALSLNTFELVMLLSGYGIKLKYVYHSSHFLPLDNSPSSPKGLVELLPSEFWVFWTPPNFLDLGGSLKRHN